jgi:hypothetical protein
VIEKKQEIYKAKYEVRPIGKLKPEEREELIDMEKKFKEFTEKLKSISILRSEYIIRLAALVDKYSKQSTNTQYQKVIFTSNW